MAEITTPRLMAAAKEFNVGKDTLVDFLLARGFSKDDLKPTSKLTEDMYRALVQEFQSDKVAKLKSDQIDLPKGSVETRKKKEDETVVFKKDIKKAAPVEEVKEEPAPPPPPPPVIVEPQVVLSPVVEEQEPELIEDDEEARVIENIKAEKLEGPKILGRI